MNTIEDALTREMKIIPICIDMESIGICISPTIIDDFHKYNKQLQNYETLLIKVCNGAEPGKKQWFEIARRKGIIDESKIVYTPKGNPRYGREFLEAMIADEEIKNALSKRSKLKKALSTYIIPYKLSYNMYNGRYYPWFSQTRGTDDYGTSTGRFSSNFQQIPRNSQEDDLPNIRSYILPDDNDSFIIKRDFSGQELRVAAHYAEGGILEAYKANPRLDVHTFVRDEIYRQTGIWLENTGEDRVIVKSISFLKLYGGGPKLLAERMGMTFERAKFFFNAYDEAIPEFKALNNDVISLAKKGKPIRTWGGRPYMVEPTTYIDGNRREFYYKLLNVLIQGSSADMTKEAMVRYHYSPNRKGRLMMTVHDELIVSVNKAHLDEEMSLLRWAMDGIPGFDVPLLSEGKYGTDLSKMEPYNDR